MNPAKLGKLGSRTQLTQLSEFSGFGNKPTKPSYNLTFNVLLNPAQLGKLGSRTQVTWFSCVLEPNEPSSKSFVALAMNPLAMNPAKTWIFICFNEPS